MFRTRIEHPASAVDVSVAINAALETLERVPYPKHNKLRGTYCLLVQALIEVGRHISDEDAG